MSIKNLMLVDTATNPRGAFPGLDKLRFKLADRITCPQCHEDLMLEEPVNIMRFETILCKCPKCHHDIVRQSLPVVQAEVSFFRIVKDG